MAILNATPDSFFAGSRTADEAAIERRVRECLDQGADLIDVGGYSSRPGADAVAPDEEWRRVSTALGVVRRLAPHMPVSVDTFRASVAAQAAERFGEVIINDISAGELDPAMPATVARLGVPYIIMHMKGDPQTMQTLTDYRGVRLFRASGRGADGRGHPAREHRARPRIRIRQNPRTEL